MVDARALGFLALAMSRPDFGAKDSFQRGLGIACEREAVVAGSLCVSRTACRLLVQVDGDYDVLLGVSSELLLQATLPPFLPLSDAAFPHICARAARTNDPRPTDPFHTLPSCHLRESEHCAHPAVLQPVHGSRARDARQMLPQKSACRLFDELRYSRSTLCTRTFALVLCAGSARCTPAVQPHYRMRRARPSGRHQLSELIPSPCPTQTRHTHTHAA